MVTFRLNMDGFDDLQFLCVFTVILTEVISFQSIIIPQQKMFFRFIGQPGIIHFVQIKKMMVGVYDFKIQIKPRKIRKVDWSAEVGLSGESCFQSVFQDDGFLRFNAFLFDETSSMDLPITSIGL